MTFTEWMTAAYPDLSPNTGPWMLCKNAWNAALAKADDICATHAEAVLDEAHKHDEAGEEDRAEQCDAVIHALNQAGEDIRCAIADADIVSIHSQNTESEK